MVQSKLYHREVEAKVSSVRSKLSKPKPAAASFSSSSETMRKTALSREELMANQARHREKAEANGKAVPYYRKK